MAGEGVAVTAYGRASTPHDAPDLGIDHVDDVPSRGRPVTAPFRCCNETYTRDEHGVWRYPWGAPVPGAQDLTLSLARRLGLAELPVDGGAGAEVARGAASGSDGPATQQVAVVEVDGEQDMVVAMLAPELNAELMLTVADIAEAAGVTKATIDSYRYRGYLPEPQVVRARTPLWSRPVITHWLQQRPGCGWRTDVYGARREAVRRMPVTGNRRPSGRG